MRCPVQPRFYENRPALWAPGWRRTRPNAQTHKYDRGHVWVWGGPRLPGAPTLSALGAAVSGAGAVTLLTDRDSWPIYAAQMRSVMRSEERRVGKECRARWWVRDWTRREERWRDMDEGEEEKTRR